MLAKRAGKADLTGQVTAAYMEERHTAQPAPPK